MMMPFATILHWASRLFGEDVSGRVVAPLLADWNHEQRQAATSWRHGLIAARWTLALVRTAACVSWRHPAPGWRALRAMSVFLLAGTFVLLLPFTLLPFTPWWSRPGLRSALIYVVPQALTLALPFALLPAAMALGASPSAGAPPQARRRLARVVAATTVVTLLNVGWIVPLANQEWRVAMSGRSLPRGLRELTLPELRTTTLAAGVPQSLAAREVRTRVLVALGWPIALAVLGWRIGRSPFASSVWAMAAWWVFAALMIAVVDGWRHVSRELPTALVPVLWLAMSALFRPRDRGLTGTPVGR